MHEGWDDAHGVDGEVFRGVLLLAGEVDDVAFVVEAFFGETEADAAGGG